MEGKRWRKVMAKVRERNVGKQGTDQIQMDQQVENMEEKRGKRLA